MLGAILDVAIALVFVFGLFSLIVSALNEIWLSFMDKRADFLIEGLAELLQDPDRKPVNHWNWFQAKRPSPAVAKLCDHGLINVAIFVRHPPAFHQHPCCWTRTRREGSSDQEDLCNG